MSDRTTFDEVVTGSFLLLAGELMRFHRVKNAILYSNALATICTEILSTVLETIVPSTAGAVAECQQQQQQPQGSPSKEGSLPGRKRRLQQSISGRYVGKLCLFFLGF